jgi:poly(3-hydroxyalkanoate) synthetase
MYKESYMMWMQLWENEYNKNIEYFKIIQRQNEQLVRQDAVINHAKQVATQGTEMANECHERYLKETKKSNNLKKGIVAAFLAGVAGGIIISN